MSTAVKIGPALPADLAVTRINTDKPVDKQQASANLPPVINGEIVAERPDGTVVVRTHDSLGSIVETIVGTPNPKVETPAELKARVKDRYVDSLGNTVETY